MSKLSEYLALIPKGIKNFDKVLEGIKNQVKIELGTIPQEDFEVIVGRRAICATCPYMSTNAIRLGYYGSARTDEHCIQCGCPIKSKTASLESNCGIEQRNIDYPENPLPLKWKAIK